ncbi:X-type DNA polymerase [Cryptosporidium ubiquitum]|uniref:X-type DNA polymerase n=1 Tax=Cryptosporidium ubiquitum TaxID=857276 RepID=A0A1J4MEN2_9CRYT|nr:X-type DNA polymerase [Cryptosporidium ubiquitum]OII72694.1 X-type DNA polymerase [Cryptosporidium ubiquitum]
MLDIQKYKISREMDNLYTDIIEDFINKYDHKMVPRIVSLIDMDAFFAQVYHVEYNIPRDKPLAVIHNHTVLAVNYPSREKGVSRKMTKEEILSVCPEIIIPQNAFLDVRGQYLQLFDDDLNQSNQHHIKNQITYQKLSLDIFRKASRMIFSKLKSYLPTCNAQIASIDEIFFDLTDIIRKIFDTIKAYISNHDYHNFTYFDQLKSEICINEINTNLLLNDHIHFDNFIKVLFPELFDEQVLSNILNILYPENDHEINNYNDISKSYSIYCYKLPIKNLTFQEMCLILASILIYRARKRLKEETTYTCSSGIFLNKIYSKMVSSLKKPNGQTVLLHRWFEPYIKDTYILKLRFLGGKLGKSLIEKFPEIKTIKDLQKLTLKQLIHHFGERNGLYLFNSSRGIDDDPVGNNFETSNSLQSSKIFRIPLNNYNQIENWLKIFSCEIFYRNQSNYQISKRKPTKITVKIKIKNNIVKTRTGDLIYNSDIPNKNNIFESAKNIILNKFGLNIFPCKFLGISISGYIKCNKNDDNFKIEFKTCNINQLSNNKSIILKNSNFSNIENEYLKFDNVLMDAINNEIFKDNENENISSIPIKDDSIIESKYIYKDWPFVIGKDSNKRKGKKNSSSNNQVNIQLSSRSPCRSVRLVNKKNVISKLTQYKQTKLKFTLP